MFFVTLLLNEVLSWVRTRPGTSALRAILYMDEIFGYMPPVAEPPSKRPLLTLLKQARAYGLGVVLATQNPVDLDYKGLSNTGTWFLGRLQTERDKLRVLDGLEGVESGEAGFDRQRVEKLLSGLGKRVFLLHNVHESEPVLFRTRWAMSYLRGPLTRDQIRDLMRPIRDQADAEAGTTETTAAAIETAVSDKTETDRPIVSPDVREVFLPVDQYTDSLSYQPGVLGIGTVHFSNRNRTREASEDIVLVQSDGGAAGPADWAEATEVALERDRLGDSPAGTARFASFDGSGPTAKGLKAQHKGLADHLYRNRRYELWKSPLIGELSQPGESERDFRIRLGELAREARDKKIEELRNSYGKRIESLSSKVLTAEQRLDREKEQASSSRLNTAISMGTTLLSAFLGRRRLSSTTLSKAGTAARGFGRSSKEAEDVRRAESALEGWEDKLADLERELEEEVDAMEELYDPTREELEVVELRPRRTDIDVQLVALAWIPFEETPDGGRRWLMRSLMAG